MIDTRSNLEKSKAKQAFERQNRWDKFFLEMAEFVATASKDPSTKVGCVIAREDQTVASVGFNGFSRHMDDDPCLYDDRETKLSRIIHAEMNAILNAHGPVQGYTLYCTFPPCDRCAVFISQAGIKRVVCRPVPENRAKDWCAILEKSEQYFKESGIQFNIVYAASDVLTLTQS